MYPASFSVWWAIFPMSHLRCSNSLQRGRHSACTHRGLSGPCLLRQSAILWRALSAGCNAGLSQGEGERGKWRGRGGWAILHIFRRAGFTPRHLDGELSGVGLTCCTAARLWSCAVLRLCCCCRAAVCSIRCCCWAAYICCRYCAAVLGCRCSACWNTCTQTQTQQSSSLIKHGRSLMIHH